MVEGRVNNTGAHTLRQSGVKNRITHTTRNTDPVALGNTPLLRILRMNFQNIFLVPSRILGTTSLRAHVVLTEYASRCHDEWETT